MNKVNAALAAAGIEGELVRGRRDYFYFWGGRFPECRSSSVMTSHLTDFTVEEWVAQAREFLSELEPK